MEPDSDLLERFDREVWSKMPRAEGGRIEGATRLEDVTADMRECAAQYGADIGGARIFAKFDSDLPYGSIKARPAAYILREAITSGRLRGGGTVIEATSGNFGIALGGISKTGLRVISLVSRKLQEGVFAELRGGGIEVVDLDMEVCPAPGMEGKANAAAAKAAAAEIRSRLVQMGFDAAPFDGRISEIEGLLEAQDAINLAKEIAGAYGFFCPEQYDNELNLEAHRGVTAPEIDSQLGELGTSLGDADVLCAFGTGGTSGGIARYVSEKYGKKSVRVVFPPQGQDVAGIRTRATASGLSMYRPSEYAAEHEVDFEKARKLMRFMVGRGHDIGESSALALYQAMALASGGGDGGYVVIVADGAAKYKKSLEERPRMQVSLQDAASSEYDRVVWVHTQYTPREEGIRAIAESLGVDESKIAVPKASTVDRLLATRQIPDELKEELGPKTLLVCMAGNTSLMTAKVLAEGGVATESLNGGIMGLAGGKSPAELIRQASE